MNIDDLEEGLPNGLHDAHLLAFSSDPVDGRADFVLDVWMGDLHSSEEPDRERRRRARLELSGLTYLVLDSSNPRHQLGEGLPVQIDSCAADDDPERIGQVPPGGFAGRFFVADWNAFVHFAALDANLVWIDAN